ncbi:MAG: hypothetical protein R3C26_01030 [Calditrichia bacterium]
MRTAISAIPNDAATLRYLEIEPTGCADELYNCPKISGLPARDPPKPPRCFLSALFQQQGAVSVPMHRQYLFEI